MSNPFSILCHMIGPKPWLTVHSSSATWKSPDLLRNKHIYLPLMLTPINIQYGMCRLALTVNMSHVSSFIHSFTHRIYPHQCCSGSEAYPRSTGHYYNVFELRNKGLTIQECLHPHYATTIEVVLLVCNTTTK